MYAIAIHGGAGTLSGSETSAAQEQAYRESLGTALDAGYAVLERGGPSLDAAIAAVCVLEDDPLFNAGRGAVLTRDGAAELDASVMDGRTLKAGAVAFGTVGAVALDDKGNVAAATSTGGMTGKRWGRVGDSPIIGAGTYASNAGCAVSATGHGEYFIRTVVAHDICAQMQYAGMSLAEAAKNTLARLKSLGGNGGVIAVDPRGEIVLEFNTEGMFRGARSSAGRREVAIYRQ